MPTGEVIAPQRRLDAVRSPQEKSFCATEEVGCYSMPSAMAMRTRSAMERADILVMTQVR
jgi:hypothetical protein